MKWSKLKDKYTKPEDEDPNNFRYYQDENKILSTHKLWVTYNMSKPMSRPQQADYEILVGGFLLYYDDIVRNTSVDHSVYFKWSENQKSVSIYLDPPPAQPNIKKYGVKLIELKPPHYGNTVDPPQPPPPPPPPRNYS